MLALVVDDSRTMRMVLARMLGSLGLQVREAADGREGLAQLQLAPLPELVLLDWHMPTLEGPGFVAAARRAPYGFTGPILMVTAETEAAQISEAIAAGVDEYIMKPFTKEALAGKLRLVGLDL